ncbi:MAG: hypothetical protein KAV87_06935 [Desulfobacteraceae bacterium]|nr:hypothetical protein [Desulfobacteraceae bacterium]
MKPLSTVFGRKYNIADEITALYSHLEQIDGVKAMVQAPEGWELIKSGMMGVVSGYDVSVQELSNDPEKNKTAIIGKIAMRSALMGFVGCVDKLLETEIQLRENLQKLNETAGKAGLSSEIPSFTDS